MAGMAPAFALGRVLGPQAVPVLLTDGPRLPAASQDTARLSSFDFSRTVFASAASLLAAAAVRRPRKSRCAVPAVGGAEEPQQEAEKAPSSFWEAAVARPGRRASLFFATAAGASAGPAARARELYATEKFEDGTGTLKLPDTGNCYECDGGGLVKCVTCTGTGMYRKYGMESDSTAIDQLTECPDCNGLGQKICERCSGTGLPEIKMRGYLRDPAFAKVLWRLKRQRVDVNTIGKFQTDVRRAVKAIEKRDAELKAKAAAKAAM
eukprot:TRINITY_DN17788_c0_g3_i1.p1 TRINITY_DN17788_c0_g3~~TRINITY_DN17788_c0_g3_i1.p1  ORF type:complete len:265 (+),score=53.89 TRINITY_DN17788_c0_g3_i1:90-884(+)